MEGAEFDRGGDASLGVRLRERSSVGGAARRPGGPSRGALSPAARPPPMRPRPDLSRSHRASASGQSGCLEPDCPSCVRGRGTCERGAASDVGGPASYVPSTASLVPCPVARMPLVTGKSAATVSRAAVALSRVRTADAREGRAAPGVLSGGVPIGCAGSREPGSVSRERRFRSRVRSPRWSEPVTPALDAPSLPHARERGSRARASVSREHEAVSREHGSASPAHTLACRSRFSLPVRPPVGRCAGATSFMFAVRRPTTARPRVEGSVV
jgi:hypothetical protein